LPDGRGHPAFGFAQTKKAPKGRFEFGGGNSLKQTPLHLTFLWFQGNIGNLVQTQRFKNTLLRQSV
jgi:hypothetical protein